jgi:PKD repeat protein
MRKIATYFALSIAVIGAICLVQPPRLSCGNMVPDERQAYVDLFNARLAAMPEWEEGEEGEEHEKYNQPDMFAAFDRLKRMDPATGEVPANGMINAYEYFLSEWGYPEIVPSETGSNYGLLWDHRGPTGIGGRARAILWDPNSVSHKGFFAGGVGGGLWHTDDVTVLNPNWTQVSPLFGNIAVTCINSDPSNSQVLYFGTGEGWNNVDALRGAGVWKSTDGGMVWDQLPSTNIPNFYYCQGIEVTSDGVLYVATKSGLWRSADGGTTISKVLGTGLNAAGDWMTDIEQAGNGDLFVGVSGAGVYKSAASLGATQGTIGSWTHLSTSFQAGYSRVELAVGGNNSNYVYAVCNVSDASSPIYRSTNGGTTWTTTPGQPNLGNDISNGQAWYDLTIQVDPADHLTVYTGGIDQHRSTNGGSAWTQITSGYGIPGLPYMHPDQHYTIINPANNQEVVFANDGGIYHSTNRGTNVAEHNNNFNVTQYYSCAIDPRAGKNKIIGGAQDNGSSMVSAPGVGVGISLTGSDGAYVAINALNPDTMYTTTQYATVRRTRNNGVNFSAITNTTLNENNTLFINPLEIDPVNPNNLYQSSTSLWHHPAAASGSAAGWVRRSASVNTNITAIAPAYNPSTVVYFAAGGTVYRVSNISTSNSTTVHPTVNPTGLGNGYINCVMVDPADNNHIVVTYSSYGVAKRVAECRNADQGANAVWKTLTGNLPDIPCNWAALEPNNPNGLLVGTDIGIFRCSDITQPAASIYWTPESMGMGLARVEQIRVRHADKMVFIGTHGRGFFSTNSYNLAPQASFAALNTVNACNGYVQFSDSSANAPNSWAWDFGDVTTSTLQNPQHQYAASGTYVVSLTVTNPNGTSTTSQSITVNVLTPPIATASADTSGCPGDTIQLSATGGGTYAWSPAGALINPTSATPTFVVTSTRTFIVTVTDSNGCTDTDTMVVTGNASPSVWAGTDQTITTVGGSVSLTGSGAATYVWSPATGLSCTNCPNPVASPTVTTVYTCTGYSAAGCSRSDNMTVFVTLVGVDPGQQGGYSIDAIAPQPLQARGIIRFTLPESQAVRLELIDLSGRLVGNVFEGSANAGQTQLAWERGNLAGGIYFLRMIAGGNATVKKVILE